MILLNKTFNARDDRRNERGFTLVEIMVVVVIIGLIAGLVGPKIFRNLEKAKFDTARSQMSQLKTTLATYRLDVGRYPSTMDCLIRSCGEGWAGPYLDADELPLDPWNNDYQYQMENNGKSFIMTCTCDGDGDPIVVKG